MKIPRSLRWRSDAELNEEIQAHLELEIQSNLDRGLSPEQARRAALRRFGNATLVRERARESDPFFSLETFVREVRYALRNLLRVPGFTLAASATLALAIGASTAIFTVTYRVLLNPLRTRIPHACSCWTSATPLRICHPDSDQYRRSSISSMSTACALSRALPHIRSTI